MKRAVKSMLGILLATSVAAPATVFATNGMFLIGLGTKSRGMGGVAMAYSTDALSGATNPATTMLVKNRFDIGTDYFKPQATAALGSEKEGSRANTFLIPHMGGVMKFNRKISFGMTAVGVGGGGSRYNRNLYNLTKSSTFDKPTLGVNLMVMQMNPTMAMKVGKHHAFGATLVMSVQTFRAFGLGEFARFTPSGNGDHLTNRGNDYAYGGGVRLGWMSQFFKKKLKLGAMAGSKVFMSRFHKYDELFAEGTLDTPPQVGLGAAYTFGKRFTIAFDWMRTFYTNVNAIGNVGPNTIGCLFPGCEKEDVTDPAYDPSITPGTARNEGTLGASNGLGFGWNNQDVFKLGLEYKYNRRWTFRGGWNYAESPINEDREIVFNIVAPAVTQHHVTTGFTYKPSRSSEVNFSYVHAFKFKQRGPTYIGSSAEIGMQQDSVGIAYGVKF